MKSTVRAKHRRGMSLIELVVTLLVSSVLLAGMSAPVFLALQANDDTATPEAAALVSAAALADLASDLQYALTVTERQPRACTFTVADRGDVDASPETIRVHWSGVAGEPLTRSMNGGTPKVLVSDVREFSLTYHIRTTPVDLIVLRLRQGPDSPSAMESAVRLWNLP